jgi:ornithine cyclodeaminase/alanine dehydrogenase-like protein (mu-crystallin family)
MTTKTDMSSILYLNEDSLNSLGLDMSAIVDILEDMFRLKADGQNLMPPKIFFSYRKQPVLQRYGEL